MLYLFVIRLAFVEILYFLTLKLKSENFQKWGPKKFFFELYMELFSKKNTNPTAL